MLLFLRIYLWPYLVSVYWFQKIIKFYLKIKKKVKEEMWKGRVGICSYYSHGNKHNYVFIKGIRSKGSTNIFCIL